MRRGEIWTVSDRGYAGKPRPAVIVQSDEFDRGDSATICAFTTDPTDAAILRPSAEPDAENGLLATSRIMVDKVTTVRRGSVGHRIGRLAAPDLRRLDEALLAYLGLRR